MIFVYVYVYILENLKSSVFPYDIFKTYLESVSLLMLLPPALHPLLIQSYLFHYSLPFIPLYPISPPLNTSSSMTPY